MPVLEVTGHSSCLSLEQQTVTCIKARVCVFSLFACVFMKNTQMQLTQCPPGSMRSVSRETFVLRGLIEFAQANISQNCMRDTKFGLTTLRSSRSQPCDGTMRGLSTRETDTTGNTSGGGTQASYAQSFDCIWRWFPSTLHSKLVLWFLAGYRMHFLQHGVKRPLLPIQHIFDTNARYEPFKAICQGFNVCQFVDCPFFGPKLRFTTPAF